MTEAKELLAFEDPNHEGNLSKYHSGKPCHTKGCKEPAGTRWSPYWCFKHNVERMNRISAQLEDFAEKAKWSDLVNKATADLRDSYSRMFSELHSEKIAVIRAAGGEVTVTKDQLERKITSEGCSHHKDGSKTFRAF